MSDHVIPALDLRSRPGSEEKSCAGCPALEIVADGSQICASKKIPLTLRTWDQNTRIAALKQQAKDCDLFGQKYHTNEAIEAAKRPPVIFPVGRSTERDTIPRLSMSNFSCKNCKHFIERAKTVGNIPLSAEFAGLCAAYGKVVPASLETRFAGDCYSYEVGEFPLEGVFALKTGPEYNVAYLQKRAGVVTSHLPKDFDPLTWETELEVADYHAEKGVRAWVGIKDPKSSNKVYLPIYRADYFPSEEQVKIPSTEDESMPGGYIDHCGLVFKTSVAWIELDETPALIGEAGTGKTELFRHLAWIMQLPFERITITASSEIDDLAGKFIFEDGETKFQYGRLSRSWGKPNVICLDEPNTGPNDVLQFIRPLIDNSKQLVLDQNNGEQIIRNEGCFLGMAMNPHFDYRNIGANPMADADNSRLLHFEVPLPSESVEREIVRQRLIAKDDWEIPEILLDAVFAISRDIREMSKNGELPFSWGIRVQIKAARLLRWFDLRDAYLTAMGSSVDDETRDKVIAIVRSHTPSRG